jgi:hypothetical protein
MLTINFKTCTVFINYSSFPKDREKIIHGKNF